MLTRKVRTIPRVLPWAVLAILVAALLLVVLTPSPGSAHAYLQLSPAAGANLAQGPGHPPPFPGEAAATSLLLLGLALGLGGPLARRVLVRVPGPTGTALRLLLLRVARGGIVLALVASVAPLALDLAGSGEVRWTASGSYDARWAVREAGLVLLLVALSGRRGAAGGPPSRVAFVAGACLAAVGTAALGHASAGNQPVRLAATTLHLLAALTWAGSIACLGIALLRARRALPRPYMLAALRRFVRPAFVCLAVTAVTDTFLASETIGSVDAALRTTYGRSLLLKLLLVALACGLALVSHHRLRHRSQTRIPTRTVAIEGLVAVLIVLATAVVVSGQPATGPQFVDRGPAATIGSLAGRFADLQESFDLRPNRPGDATAVVTVVDTRRPPPGPVTAVSVRLGTDHPVPATVVSGGTWAARLPVLTEGDVGIEVRVTRAGAPTVTAHYGWSVAPAGRPEPRLVSRAPLRTGLRWAALVLAVGFALAGAVLLRPRAVRAPTRVASPGPGRCDTDPGEVLAGRP